ncbi:MAG: ATP-binding cassette domain-containing protein [Nitrospirae bacterium]|nr:ATP-binding cassette domain-containing protein [Nitrospirota bacterium]
MSIQVLEVWKSFQAGLSVLQGVTCSVARGEAVVLEGPTGSGKSTLLRLVIGAERADSGTILVGETEIIGRATPQLAAIRRSMGLMVQGMPLLPALTVAENVALALRAIKASSRDMRFRVYESLKAFGLEGRREAYPSQLSGGEAQCVCLARALVTRPPLVLADEPTALLDRVTAEGVIAVLRDAHVRGATMLVATHDSNVAPRLGARRVVLRGGRADDGTMAGGRG